MKPKRPVPEVFDTVSWISWRGATVCHALADPDGTETLCGHQRPEERGYGIPQVTLHLVNEGYPRRCSRCLRLAGQYADPLPPQPGQLSPAARDLLVEIRQRIYDRGYCAFHELSHAWTDRGHGGMGTLLRNLRELGLVANGPHGGAGTVSTLVLIDEEKADRLIEGEAPPKLSFSPRSRLSPLAERLGRLRVARLQPAF